MRVETWINVLTIVGSAATLYFLLHRPIAKLDIKIDSVEAKLDSKIINSESRLANKIDCVESKLSNKIDSVESKLSTEIDHLHGELTDFRIETREGLARHDERIIAIERQRPGLIVP